MALHGMQIKPSRVLAREVNMKKKSPTKHEIARAIKKFSDAGGIIHQLPEQKFTAQRVVGEEKHQVYESINVFSSLT